MRFGTEAVNKGFITMDQLIKAMRIQLREDLGKSDRRFIGEVLVEMGLMNISQVDELLEIKSERQRKPLRKEKQ